MTTEIKLVLEASDRASSKLRRVTSGIGKLSSVALPVVGVATALAGAVALGTKEYIENAAEQALLSRQTGRTVEELSALSDAFVRVGLDSGDMREAFNVIDEKQLGSLDDYAEKIFDIKDKAERVRTVMEDFGEDLGPRLLPLLEKGKGGLDEYRKEAEKMGRVLDTATAEGAARVTENLQRLGNIAGGIFNRIGTAAVTALDPLISQAASAGEALIEVLDGEDTQAAIANYETAVSNADGQLLHLMNVTLPAVASGNKVALDNMTKEVRELEQAWRDVDKAAADAGVGESPPASQKSDARITLETQYPLGYPVRTIPHPSGVPGMFQELYQPFDQGPPDMTDEIGLIRRNEERANVYKAVAEAQRQYDDAEASRNNATLSALGNYSFRRGYYDTYGRLAAQSPTTSNDPRETEQTIALARESSVFADFFDSQVLTNPNVRATFDSAINFFEAAGFNYANVREQANLLGYVPEGTMDNLWASARAAGFDSGTPPPLGDFGGVEGGLYPVPVDVSDASAERIATAIRGGGGAIDGQGLIAASKSDPLRVLLAGYGGLDEKGRDSLSQDKNSRIIKIDKLEFTDDLGLIDEVALEKFVREIVGQVQ